MASDLARVEFFKEALSSEEIANFRVERASGFATCFRSLMGPPWYQIVPDEQWGFD